jgi:hypothetical protein
LVLEEHPQQLVLLVPVLIVIVVLHHPSQQYLLLVAVEALHTLQVRHLLLLAALVEVVAVLEETLHLRLILCLAQQELLVKVTREAPIQVLDKVKLAHPQAEVEELAVLVETV